MSSSSPQAAFDVGQQRLAHIYATALLGAVTQGQAAEMLEQLDSLLDDVLARLPKLEAALASPRIGKDEKLGLLDRALAGKMLPVLLNFLKVLARRERLDCLRPIRTAAHQRYHEMMGQVEVQVQTAQPVTAAVLDQIAQRLTLTLQRKVVLNVSINPDLLGGVVVRVGDTVYDGSLDNQLERMRSGALQRAALEACNTLQRFVVPDA
jgi:F-type H+-transporting ATPase subunit delta